MIIFVLNQCMYFSGLADTDDGCIRFMESSLHLAFEKVSLIAYSLCHCFAIGHCLAAHIVHGVSLGY